MSDHERVVKQFKTYSKKSLDNCKKDMLRKYGIRNKIEILTDEPLFYEKTNNQEFDFLENQVFVLDFNMTVKNDLLYEALEAMEQYQRDIAYLSFCENQSDREIGIILNMSRSKVQRIKIKTKKQIEKMLGGKSNEKIKKEEAGADV